MVVTYRVAEEELLKFKAGGVTYGAVGAKSVGHVTERGTDVAHWDTYPKERVEARKKARRADDSDGQPKLQAPR